MQVFRALHFPFGNALEEKFFCGKAFGFRAQTIPSVTVNKKERMPLHTMYYIVDKSLYEEHGPRLNWSAFVNFITTLDLLHTSDRLNDSLRFIDESRRKYESLI